MITLRDLNEGDRDRLLNWRNQPEIRRWMYTDHVISRDEHDHWFDAVLVDASKKYWVIESNDEPVGVVNLAVLASGTTSFSFGIYVGEVHARGSGAAFAGLFAALRYAFGVRGAARVEAEVLETNHAGRRLYERLGLRDIGRVNVPGKQAIARRMSVTCSEWQGLEPSLVSNLRSRGLSA